MGDYVISWQKGGGNYYRRVNSYRSRVPKATRTVTDMRLADEQGLETSSTLHSKTVLYSDLYAEAGLSPTFNPGDTGHDFCSQTWKYRTYGDLVARGAAPQGVSLPPDAIVFLRPLRFGGLAAGPLARFQYDLSRDGYGGFDRAASIMANSINDALWAQCPDRIRGSLGQDVVDVAAFGKSLNKLLALRASGESLFKQFSRFSAKKRRQIDDVVRLIRKRPSQGAKIARQHLAGGYLSWLFQYLPWIEDLQLILKAATSTYIRARGVTRKRRTIDLGKAWDALLTDENSILELDGFPKPEGEIRVAEDFPSMTYFGPAPPYPGVRDDASFAGKLTCSVVSSWTQNYEHGAVEPLYELNKQLGLVYPSLVWDLIPWTWLVDWFVNVGDFIDRAWMSAYGEWNCSYAYATTKLVMEWRGLTYLQTARWHIHPGLWDTSVSPQSLSTSQWSILTALGLSHRN